MADYKKGFYWSKHSNQKSANWHSWDLRAKTTECQLALLGGKGLKGSQPKTTCKWRLLQIIISQLVGTYRSSLSSQSSSFALVSVSISMVSSVSVLVSPVSPSSASDSSYTAFTLQSYTLSSLHLCASARSASKVDPFPLTWCSRLLAKENITTLHWLPVIFYDGKPVGLSFVSSFCVYALNDKKFIIQENSSTD